MSSMTGICLYAYFRTMLLLPQHERQMYNNGLMAAISSGAAVVIQETTDRSGSLTDEEHTDG